MNCTAPEYVAREAAERVQRVVEVVVPVGVEPQPAVGAGLLVALIGLFVALPIVLYGQFESADSQMQILVTRAIQDRSALIAEALAPVLRETDPSEPMNLNRELAKYASSGTVLKLMYQPPDARTASRFYLVASAPPLSPPPWPS